MNGKPTLLDRSLWRAGVANLIAQATAALIPAMIIREGMIAHLHEGLKPWEGPLMRPEMFTLGWVREVATAYGWSLLCMLPGMLLFMAAINRLERAEAKSVFIWGVVGALTATPLAIGLCVLVGTTMHQAQPQPTVIAAGIFYMLVATVPVAIGFCGGIVARRFCHDSEWSNPL